MKIIALALALPLAACASSAVTRGPSVADEPRAGTQLDLVTGEATNPSFPARLTEASTPRAADRLAHRVDVELGGQARANLRLCVGGDGSVTSATVAKSSGIDALDAAFVDEAKSWRYAALASPEATACQKVEISYTVASN
jgi:TonB family protein